MRVTTKMFYERFLSDMQQNLSAMYTANEQIATGKRVNRPSDDPAAMARIVGYKASLSSITEYSRAIGSANSFLEAIDSSFSNLNDALTRAQELALSGASGTNDASARAMIAKEAAVLLENVRGIANTKVGDRYIFSGYASNAAPIDANTGEFLGDSNVFELDISQNVKVAVNIPAGDLFSFRRINATDQAVSILPPYNYDFDTTNSAITGERETPPDADPISALHMASGVADSSVAGSGSTNGGTVTITLGADDTTPINVAIAANASLNDIRTAINSANAGVKANIVNMGTAAAPDYRLVVSSVPNGKSNEIKMTVATTDVAGTGLNLLAYDPVGTQTMVLGEDIKNYNYITDTSNPNYYSFNNNYLNGTNVLRAVHFLKIALENNDTGRIQKAIGYINDVSDKVHQAHAETGARLNKLDAEARFLDDREANLSVSLSHDQDVDLARAVTDMQQRQAALDSLRTVSTDIFRTSLFDFIK